jgi:hypothetical protein
MKVRVTIEAEGKATMLTLEVPAEHAADAVQWAVTKLTNAYPFRAGHQHD